MKAFPEVEYVAPGNGMGAHIMTIHGGMELRDYFAAKAMAAFCWHTTPVPMEVVSVRAYEMADAMMEARNATK